jgi:hypothetical protein
MSSPTTTARANRAYLRRRGIACTIPEQADQIRNRKNRGSRVAEFRPRAYQLGIGEC